MPKKGVPLIWTDDKLHELGEELVNHCKREDVFHITDFLGVKKRTSTWFYDLIKKYPLLTDYHEQVREILGNKIVALAFKNGNNWAIQTFIPKYLSDVDEYLDKKREKDLAMQERAKKLAEAGVDERTIALIEKMDQVIEANDEQRSVQSKAD